MDKALLAMLYDLAGRTHEVLELKVGDIAIKDNYAESSLRTTQVKDRSCRNFRTIVYH